MKTYAYTTDVTTNASNVGAVTLAAADHLYVGKDASLIASGDGSDGVRGTQNSSVTVNGEIFGQNDGILISTQPNFGSGNVTIQSGASVSGGSSGIEMSGTDGTIVNAGTLSGYYGAYFNGENSSVVNSGDILANGLGEAIFFSGGGNLLRNSGNILNSGSNAIFGGLGTDTIINTGFIGGSIDLQDGADYLDTRQGTVSGSVDAGAGSDTLLGGSGADAFFGSTGNDVVRGYDGDDRLSGGADNDKIVGGAGDDSISGDGGRDTLTGGIGADTFEFNTAGTGNYDHITDFTVGQDIMQLDHSYFKAASVGALTSQAFHLGTAAASATDRIIYDSASGSVFYDKDGSGSASAMRVAVVTPGLALTANDFVVA